MKASDFVQAWRNKGLAAWEKAAETLVSQGGRIAWSFVPLAFDAKDARGEVHHVVVPVARDYLAIGEPDDYIRMPLTPEVAQAMLNQQGELLPTPKLVDLMAQLASVQVKARAMVPNRGSNLDDYLTHSKLIDSDIAGRGDGIVFGAKKDVVVSNIATPGKVVIYGPKWAQPQPLSNVHGTFYVDYSHGIRAVGGRSLVDGVEVSTEKLYTDPLLAPLVSNEGPVHSPRYKTSTPVAPPASLAAEGLAVLIAQAVVR